MLRGQAAWQLCPERPLNHLDSQGKSPDRRQRSAACPRARVYARGGAWPRVRLTRISKGASGIRPPSRNLIKQDRFLATQPPIDDNASPTSPPPPGDSAIAPISIVE